MNMRLDKFDGFSHQDYNIKRYTQDVNKLVGEHYVKSFLGNEKLINSGLMLKCDEIAHSILEKPDFINLLKHKESLSSTYAKLLTNTFSEELQRTLDLACLDFDVIIPSSPNDTEDLLLSAGEGIEEEGKPGPNGIEDLLLLDSEDKDIIKDEPNVIKETPDVPKKNVKLGLYEELSKIDEQLRNLSEEELHRNLALDFLHLNAELKGLDLPPPNSEPITQPKQETEVISSIPYSQYLSLIQHLNPDKDKELKNFVLRFDGLCELVCNKILIEDLLGKGEDLDFLTSRINPESMNHDSILRSHIVDVYNPFYKMIGYLAGIYPDNILSTSDQWNLVNAITSHGAANDIKDDIDEPAFSVPFNPKGSLPAYEVNKDILRNGLESIADGETLKVEVFTKENMSFQGHALLLKKINNNDYIFFDPNSGEHRHLPFDRVVTEINSQLKRCRGTDLLIIRGKDYLQRLQNERILEVVTDSNIFVKNVV